MAQILAIIVGLVALVTAVLQAARRGEGVPIASLTVAWMGSPAAQRKPIIVGAAAGFCVIVIPVLVAWSLGWSQVSRRVGSISLEWLGLALASLLVKGAWVVFEELTFRGALISLIRNLGSTVLAVGVSAVVFALAHTPGNPLDLAILALDGLGFGLAFVLTGSLWLPIVWHLSKNLSVWLVYGSGTVEFTAGLLRVKATGPEWLIGSKDGAGVLDAIVTLALLCLVLWYVWARARSAPAG